MTTLREAAHRRHDHRQSIWLIAGGLIVWCYRCGAWRPNTPARMQWHKPTGANGENPALIDVIKAVEREK